MEGYSEVCVSVAEGGGRGAGSAAEGRVERSHDGRAEVLRGEPGVGEGAGPGDAEGEVSVKRGAWGRNVERGEWSVERRAESVMKTAIRGG